MTPRLRLWQPSDDATLRRLWRRGMTDADIGARLSRSEAAVKGRRHCLGLMKTTTSVPADQDSRDRTQTPLYSSRPDLFALWDARNSALRLRLATQPIDQPQPQPVERDR